jgi:GH15 family glucan-1,4-alpha-glucosidase
VVRRRKDTVAAATSSLPEAIGGPRHCGYRYAWMHDAVFSVYALRRIGLTQEATSFLGWVLDAVERGGEGPGAASWSQRSHGQHEDNRREAWHEPKSSAVTRGIKPGIWIKRGEP